MAGSVRCAGLIALMAAAAGMAGCGTIGVRGQTQSASLVNEQPYRGASYSGSRDMGPRQPVTPATERGYAQRQDNAVGPVYDRSSANALGHGAGDNLRYHSAGRSVPSGVAAHGAAAPPVWRSSRLDSSGAAPYPTGRDGRLASREPAEAQPLAQTGGDAEPLTQVQSGRTSAAVGPSISRPPPATPPAPPTPPLRAVPVAPSFEPTAVRTTGVQTIALPPKSNTPPDPKFVRTGKARWMGASWVGHNTTSGEVFDPQRLTAAHADLPVPSFLYVTNRANGRTVMVRVNDRVPASGEHVVIVSELAARLLGFIEAGQAEVDLQYGGAASPVPNAKHEEVFLKEQPWFHRGLLRVNHDVMPTSGQAVTGQAVTGQAVESVGNGQSSTGRVPHAYYAKPTYPRWDDTRRE